MQARLFLLACLCGAVFAQPRQLNTYTATCVLTLTGTAKACTVQQPATGALNVQLIEAYVHSTAAVALTQERNGTAATATGVTEAALNADGGTPTLNAFTDSDVGVGTVIAGTGGVKVAADASLVLNLEDIQLRGNGTTKNYTIRTSAVTATVTIIIKWKEF